MTSHPLRLFPAFALLAYITVPAVQAQPQNGYSIQMLEQDMSRWIISGCRAELRDGVLHALEGDGLIRSAHRYRDFVLELSWRPLKASEYDAGIYFRSEAPESGRPWPSRYQINLKEGEVGKLIGTNLVPPAAIVKPGEWNNLKLAVIGQHATLEINGQPAWETSTIEQAEGYIGIQVEAPLGGAFEYRDVQLTEVGYGALFNGQNLDGWEGAGQDAASCWQVENGELVCTGEEGPWLRSRQEFNDFNLRLEYKVLAGGNSGVYIRVPPDGDHHGENAGIEVQILDDAAPQYADLRDYQYAGSLYAIAAATPRVSRPPEQWNLLEIDCQGESYKVIHNGVLVVSGEAAQYPELAQRLRHGFLGLQNHSERVWFRHIRIGTSAQPADAARPVRELLAQQIIDEHTTLSETQEFCEKRVAVMPQLESADEWNAYLNRLREIVLNDVMYRGEAKAWRQTESAVEWLETIEAAPEYRIKKLRYEALPGLWIPALLYEPTELSAKTPVALNVNGHDGNGKAAPYKQVRCINMAKRGMLVLNVEWFGMGQLRSDGFAHARLNQLDLCGTSGLAPFLLAMQRGIDILLAHPNADPARVAVSGLSGGGWQTIIVSALDTRVALANPVAGYSSYLTRMENFSDLGDSEQTPSDLAVHADYTHLTAMLAPRHVLLTYNDRDDCCFATSHALPPLVSAARPVYESLSAADHFHTHTNADPGNHNFERDNREALYRALQRAFYPEDPSFSAVEIPSDHEVLPADELKVAIPEENLDFQKLALQLASQLPRDRQLPESAGDANTWRGKKLPLLNQVVRYHGEYRANAREQAAEAWRGFTVRQWELRIGHDWTIPATEFEPQQPGGTAIVVNDGGRIAAGRQVHELLNRGYRVVALDPFYIGEARFHERDYLFALLVASVGERPLGVQASQIACVARWLAQHRMEGPITIVAEGPRMSLAALVATAQEQQAVGAAELYGAYGSLKEVIEANIGVTSAPEYFCFGLLEHFDVRELVALAAPRKVHFMNASDRAKQELQDLDSYYQLFDFQFSPTTAEQ